jgi:hypothetical protein
MAGRTGQILVHAHGHGLLDLDMAVLTRGFSFDMAHAAGTGLVAVNALDLFRDMHVFRQTRGFGKVFPEIAVASSPLHGAGMADKGAPPPAGAVWRWRRAAESVAPALARGRVVAVEAAGVTEVARLLLGNCLLVRERDVDLFYDLFRVFE